MSVSGRGRLQAFPTRAEGAYLIAYRDFHLRAARYGFFGFGRDLTTRVTFDEAVEQANAWIAAEGVRVINVETVSSHQRHAMLLKGLRVWFEGSFAKPGKAVEP